MQPASDWPQRVAWGGGEKLGKLQKGCMCGRGASLRMLDRKPRETRLYSATLLVFSYKNLSNISLKKRH